jgi:hypothetical protein
MHKPKLLWWREDEHVTIKIHLSYLIGASNKKIKI